MGRSQSRELREEGDHLPDYEPWKREEVRVLLRGMVMSGGREESVSHVTNRGETHSPYTQTLDQPKTRTLS